MLATGKLLLFGLQIGASASLPVLTDAVPGFLRGLAWPPEDMEASAAQRFVLRQRRIPEVVLPKHRVRGRWQPISECAFGQVQDCCT